MQTFISAKLSNHQSLNAKKANGFCFYRLQTHRIKCINIHSSHKIINAIEKPKPPNRKTLKPNQINALKLIKRQY